MEILKVQVKKDEKVVIDYSIQAGSTTTKSQCIGTDKARQAFYETFNKLAPLAKEICEYEKEDEIQLPSISLSYHGESKIAGVIFTVSRKLENSSQPLIANTPIKYINEVNDNTAGDAILHQAHEENVLKLIEECKAYINGDRQQTQAEGTGTLDLNPEKKEEEK